MNFFNVSPAVCLAFGLLCGFVALLAWLKERRDAAANWTVVAHPEPICITAYKPQTSTYNGRPVLNDEHGRPLMYLDTREAA